VKLYRCIASALRIRETPEGRDLGGRLVHGQVARVHGSSWDGAWMFVQVPAGMGWAASRFLEELPPAGRFEPDPEWPRVPHGLEELGATFGEPGANASTQGLVEVPEELQDNLARVLSWDPTRKVRSFRCHRLLEPVFVSVFTELYRRGLWDLLEDFGGCYNYRRARGLDKLSTHSWGIAVDLNVISNPLGARPAMDRRIVGIFEDHGFLWGGHFPRPDGMHFQYATGY
jgi:hypothetical protein